MSRCVTCLSSIKAFFARLLDLENKTRRAAQSIECESRGETQSFECDAYKSKSICLENDPKINALKIHDCYSISVANCPKITKIPDMNYFSLLEVIKIQHCTISACYTHFPNTLRMLEISYCSMVDFSPANLPATLAELNLSHNKLKGIPKIVESLYESNKAMHLVLNNNDFWYTMYSNLSPSLISAQTVKELVFANKINLVSTEKLQNAVRILATKNCSEESKWLAAQICKNLETRKTHAANTCSNAENVHLDSVQESVKRSIDYVMKLRVAKRATIEDAMREFESNDRIVEFLKAQAAEPSYHDGYKIAYKHLFEQVYSIARESPYRESLALALRDEIVDGIDICLTGQLSRLVNALNGFVPGVFVNISKKEELSNSIIALRKKHAIMYGDDMDLYIRETIPAVWQLLEDMCVAEAEHAVWLEYV